MTKKPPKPPKPEGVEPNLRGKSRGKGGSKAQQPPAEKKVKLTRQSVRPDEWEAFNDEVLRGSDRAGAILTAAHLETLLLQRIAVALKRDDEGTLDTLTKQNGPLSTFSAKIEMAYAMGLFDVDTYEDLHRIRQIRNFFAHAIRPITFREEDVSILCKKLGRALEESDYHTILMSKFSLERRCFLATALFIWSKFAQETAEIRNRRGFVNALQNFSPNS